MFCFECVRCSLAVFATALEGQTDDQRFWEIGHTAEGTQYNSHINRPAPTGKSFAEIQFSVWLNACAYTSRVIMQLDNRITQALVDRHVGTLLVANSLAHTGSHIATERQVDMQAMWARQNTTIKYLE